MPKPNEEQTLSLNWTKIVAWTMTTMFSLLLALVLFVFRGYAAKIDRMDMKLIQVGEAIAIFQTQNSSTALQISEIKESIKDVRSDMKELRRP